MNKRSLALLSLVTLLVAVGAGAGCDADDAPSDGTPSLDGGPDGSSVDGAPQADASGADGGVDGAVDANPTGYDFSCAGTPDPTTAADPVTVSGRVFDAMSQAGLSGVTVEVFRYSDNVKLAQGSSASAGTFSVSIPTGGTAVRVYLKFSRTGYLPSYAFAARPASVNFENLNAALFTPATMTAVYQFSGAGVQTPGTGTVGFAVVDCAGAPVDKTIVSLTPAASKTVYLSGNSVSENPSGTYAEGLGLALNAQAGTTQVAADRMGQAFRSYDFKTYANAVSLVLVHP